jgi:hypothetical protein
LASFSAAALRCFSLSFSRAASAVARNCAFDGVADIYHPCPAVTVRQRLA